jgi:hypothetical protein
MYWIAHPVTRAITEHASSCEPCKAKLQLPVTIYHHQPTAEESFDFDLAKLVMAQLP